MTDEERIKFLQALREADVEMTQWEAEFCIAALRRGERGAMTQNDRETIDTLHETYKELLPPGNAT